MKILFLCHGNICRSPMAEFIMNKLLADNGVTDVQVDSLAVSNEETGNGIYPPAAAKLREKGIPFDRCRTARKMTMEDYRESDMVIVMDNMNVRLAGKITGGDPENKISLLMEYAGKAGAEVSDPWYTGDFERAYQDIAEGCKGLIETIKRWKA